MSVYGGPISGKGRQSLTRADVEERLRQAGGSQNLRLVGEDISGSSLSGLDLSGADLRRVDLSDTDLVQANLREAKLEGADLRGANLERANLRGANLERAKLEGANLIRAKLGGAKLEGAILIGANLEGAILVGAKLEGAILVGANLRRTILRGAYLEGAKLEGAKLEGAIGMPLGFQRGGEPKPEVGPALHLRIQEEPLTVQHLSATLDTFTSLYTKMWLLQQRRFDDFVHYTNHKDHRFEEEANLLIAELKYNSPLTIKFRLPNPKAFVEALQMLVDLFPQARLRKQAMEEENRSKQLDNQLKEEAVRKERLNNADHTFETMQRAAAMVERLYPGLDKEKRDIALQSLMKDILQLAGDQTLEITLLLPPPDPQQQSSQPSPQEQRSSMQTSEKTA